MKHKWLLPAALLMVLYGLTLPVSLAEMNAFELPPGAIHMYGKGDTPDPFPWGSVLPPEFCCKLNSNGDSRGDGWPDFDVNPVSKLAEVTWAYQELTNTQIAFAETLPTGGWGPIFLLTATANDDLDPNISFSPSGGTKIVYWRDDATPKVFMLERDATTGAWLGPQRVNAGSDPARYPSGIVALGKVHVAYEVELASGKDIVIAGRADDPNVGGPFTPELITHVSYTGKTKLQVEARGSKLWVSWVNSTADVGYSQFDGNDWTIPQYKPCTDCGSLPPEEEDDLEAVRAEIRRGIVNSP